MANLQYYKEENERHPKLHATHCQWYEAKCAIKWLVRHFKLKEPLVKWTRGNRFSRATESKIILNYENLNWLLVAHEFAHCLHAQKYHRTGTKMRWHGKRHRRLVDRIAAIIEKKEWVDGFFLKKSKERQDRVTERERLKKQAAADKAKKTELEQQAQEDYKKTSQYKLEQYEEKVAKNRDEIRNLKTRIKRLQTAIKKRERKISATMRVRNKLAKSLEPQMSENAL